MAETTEISHAKAQRRKEELGTSHSLHPLVELTLTRVREFLREKEAVFWVFIFPVLMTFALGIAFRNTAPDKTLVAIEADSAKASETASILSRSSEITATVLSPDEAAQALRSGKVSIVVKPVDDVFEYRFDPTRPESRAARLLVDDVLQRGKGRADVANVGEVRVTEPGARYVDFLVPGLIGMNLMGSGLWGLGFTVVIARSRKILKRFAATPMRRSHYLLSFMLSRLIFLVLEVAAVVIFAWLAFGFTVRGSWLSVVLVTMLGGFTFSGLGLLVAARLSGLVGSKRYSNASSTGLTTIDTFPLRNACAASSGLNTVAVISLEPDKLFAISVARAPLFSIATKVLSGAVLRKAIPSANVINTGKMKTQNTASFSRRNSRTRIKVSSMSG